MHEQRAGLPALVCIGVSVTALVLAGNVVMVCSQGWRSHVMLHMHVALKHVGSWMMRSCAFQYQTEARGA